ncbi:MAG: hypothetical protein ACREKL_04845, partial [Chthoniobacterales bacterium]
METIIEPAAQKPRRPPPDQEFPATKLSPQHIFDVSASNPAPFQRAAQPATAPSGQPAAIRRVLVPTDFSCASTRALQIAARVARA